MTEKLKPCPFCGNTDDLIIPAGWYAELDPEAQPRFAVFCGNCGAMGPSGPEQLKRCVGWNTRASDAVRDLLAACDEMVRVLRRDVADRMFHKARETMVIAIAKAKMEL